MKNLGKAMEEYGLTLFDSEGADLIETYVDMSLGEIGELGHILEESVIEFPVARTLSAVVKAVNTFRDYFLIQKWLAFQKKFHEGKAPEKEIRRRRLAAEKKEKWILHEIELLLIRIDNISDKRNVEILSGIYIEYLNGRCSWELFEEIALILERFIYQDTEQLVKLYNSYIKSKQREENQVVLTMFENNHCDRLVALGLVWQRYTTVLNGGVNVEYLLTEAGIVLAQGLLEDKKLR